MPTNWRVQAARRLAERAEAVLADFGFTRRDAFLNREADGGFVQVFEVQLSKYVQDPWATMDLGVYSGEVASTLEWPKASGPVHIEYCQFRDLLPRRFGSLEWPLKGTDDELTGQIQKRGMEFFRRFDSPQKIVDAWTADTRGSARVRSIVIAVLANSLGNRSLVESIVREEWRDSIGRPFQNAMERIAGKLGVDLEKPA